MHRRDVLGSLGAAAAGAAFTPRAAHARPLAGAARLPWRGLFSAHQRETVAAIAELILPETDTPGARAAGVPEFIETVVADWMTDEARERFVRGLADVDARCRAMLGRAFLEASPAEQAAFLTGLEAEARALRAANSASPPHFFEQVKRYTLHGYYNSEVGMRQELRWHVIPGRYDGCMDVAAIPLPGEE